MKYKKRFSIVIPSYQCKKQLGNTLEALNRQNALKGELEVIVVDDGSSDGTGDYIKKINKSYEFKYIYLNRTPGSSRSKTRNTGILAAEGEIIVFIDSDIIVKEDYLSQIDKYFKIDPNILLIGHRIMLTEDVSRDDLLKENMFSDEKFIMNSFEKFELRHALYISTSFNSRCSLYPWIHVFSCNMSVSREMLDRSGYFDEDFKGWGMEDVELGYRLYKIGAKIVTGINIEAFHQPHTPSGKSMSQEEKERGIDANTMRFIKKHPYALNLPEEDIINFFKGKIQIDFDVVKGFRSPVNINFRDRSSLESVKKKILRLSRKRNVRVYVYDYVEDTDLDIWIQLLEGVVTVPRYYPMLRGQYMKNIANVEIRPLKFKIKKLPGKLNQEIRKKLQGGIHRHEAE